MPKPFRLAGHEVTTFIGTSDPDRAVPFYRDVLGLTVISEERPFAIVFDCHGTVLRLTIVNAVVPAGYTVLGWRVPDVAVAVAALSTAGVRFERYAGMTQDERGIWASPGGTRVAWFLDPDGNTLSVSGP